MRLPPDYIIISASPDDDESIRLVKKEIADKKLTAEQVKIVRRDGSVLAITKDWIEI